MEGRFLYFEKFRLDLRTGELSKEGRPVRLAPQPTKLLLLLARSPGELVNHEEIQKELWGDETFVDFEQAVKKCAKQVRDALGDEAEEPSYVETVPRRGYRFIGLVREASPYPGLSAFLEKDARYFFGREGEAEALWNKIERRRLLALIGPSGAGKTSFLRAGLLPSRPEGWPVEMVTPGSSALSALPNRDSESGPYVLVVDAFEELFTRNPPEVQKEFSERLGELAGRKDTHVLLSMRDDFLFRCHEQESLQEVFLDLTPLGALTGAALREAVERPAASMGYEFEEGLVEEMVQEVEKLPLLAFAAAELWEKRDRERKVLTRAAYEETGRVGGALAQYAERTLRGIGEERTVREIFRNLTTSQGTRVSMKREELLSVFTDRVLAESVLSRLVDARLLTSSEGEVEIVHESLLTAWPRLTQWQAQDAEGTVLRDQLRQAARTWHERGRPEDLLWTGTSYRELGLWRERYGVGLTASEDEFAKAASELAGRRRRHRRAAVAALVAFLLGAVLVVTSLWRSSVLEVHRREAAQILALGRLEREDRPTAALAHALASLERADTDEARRFAVETLWHGASAFVLEESMLYFDFSPDGHWLVATGHRIPNARLWSIDGGSPKMLSEVDPVSYPAFSPSGEFLAIGGDSSAKFWSLAKGKELRTLKLEGKTDFRRRGGHLFSGTRTSQGMAIRAWTTPDVVPDVVALLDLGGKFDLWDVDSTGEWLVTGRDNGIYLSSMHDSTPEHARHLGGHSAELMQVQAHATESRIVSSDRAGDVQVWRISGTSAELERTLKAAFPAALLDPSVSWMVITPWGASHTSDVAHLWDLEGPPDADPFVLKNGNSMWVSWTGFDPSGRWLATANSEFGMLWPFPPKRTFVLRGQAPPNITISFTPDGRSLVSTSDAGTVRLWPLGSASNQRSQILMNARPERPGDETALLGLNLSIAPSGKRALVGSRWDPRVFLVPLDGGPARLMPGFTLGEGFVHPFAFSRDNRFAAAAGSRPPILRLWNLETNETKMLDLKAAEECSWGSEWEGFVWGMEFLGDGRLLTVGAGGVLIWDLEHGTSESLRSCTEPKFRWMRLSADAARERFLILVYDTSARLSTLSSFDLVTRSFHEIQSHGNRLSAVALDPTGTVVVTGDFDGVVRAGPITGGEPHLLYGHELEISSVAVSPDGKWIASGSQDGTIRLWPMPKGQPFHALAYEKLLDRIRAMTNLRLVADEATDTGYRIEVGPFPGWRKVPEW
jgi:WD40 repeat protein/DNA-binding winged helix-turn-helix (wHTH) protein